MPLLKKFILQFPYNHATGFIKPELNKKHILVKIADTINWDNITNQLSKFYCKDNGRPTKPARIKVGLLFLQRISKAPDEDTVKILHENIYAQYLCNVSFRQSKKFINRTTLVKFRSRIGLEGIKILSKKYLAL